MTQHLQRRRLNTYRQWFFVSFLFIFPINDLARACSEPDGQTHRVIAIRDSLTIALDSGAEVLLAGIYIPLTPSAPLTKAGHSEVLSLLDGKDVRLLITDQKPDRYNRIKAHVFALNDGRAT
jgi:hypothetical protein